MLFKVIVMIHSDLFVQKRGKKWVAKVRFFIWGILIFCVFTCNTSIYSCYFSQKSFLEWKLFGLFVISFGVMFFLLPSPSPKLGFRSEERFRTKTLQFLISFAVRLILYNSTLLPLSWPSPKLALRKMVEYFPPALSSHAKTCRNTLKRIAESVLE